MGVRALKNFQNVLGSMSLVSFRFQTYAEQAYDISGDKPFWHVPPVVRGVCCNLKREFITLVFIIYQKTKVVTGGTVWSGFILWQIQTLELSFGFCAL